MNKCHICPKTEGRRGYGDIKVNSNFFCHCWGLLKPYSSRDVTKADMRSINLKEWLHWLMISMLIWKPKPSLSYEIQDKTLNKYQNYT